MLHVYMSHVIIVKIKKGKNMKKSIIAFSLLVLFILITPNINAAEHNAIQEQPEKQLSNTLNDDEIEILFVWGGRSVNVLVKNIADKDLYNIDWEIEVINWHTWGLEAYGQGTIDKLSAGQKTIVTLETGFGIMNLIVYINIGDAEENPKAMLIGPFIFFRIWWLL